MAGMRPSAYRIKVPDSVGALLRGMHPHLKRKIKSSFKIIVSNPNEGKALKEELTGLRSFKVSRFRIVYRARKDIIEVVAVGPRDRVYEETLLLLRKEERG
jgi:mRNA interferase RelE/StbE